MNNIILTSTGAAKALRLVIPEMQEIGFIAESVRIPTSTGSLIILVINIQEGLEGGLELLDLLDGRRLLTGRPPGELRLSGLVRLERLRRRQVSPDRFPGVRREVRSSAGRRETPGGRRRRLLGLGRNPTAHLFQLLVDEVELELL